LTHGAGLPLGLVAALAVGLGFGLTNGLLVVAIGIPPFISTLGTLGIAQGIALSVTGGQSVVGIGDALPALYASSWVGVPFSILVAASAYVEIGRASCRERV